MVSIICLLECVLFLVGGVVFLWFWLGLMGLGGGFGSMCLGVFRGCCLAV